jgi:hypothetical protein
MSDTSSSSPGSSSSASPSSSRHGSYTSRPSPRREHSYTHIFPANPSTRNKPRKTSLTPSTDIEQRGSISRTNTQLDQSERTRQFYSGLDWLLEATSSSWGPMTGNSDFGTPLTEGALRQLNAQRKDSCFVVEADGVEGGSKG